MAHFLPRPGLAFLPIAQVVDVLTYLRGRAIHFLRRLALAFLPIAQVADGLTCLRGRAIHFLGLPEGKLRNVLVTHADEEEEEEEEKRSDLLG